MKVKVIPKKRKDTRKAMLLEKFLDGVMPMVEANMLLMMTSSRSELLRKYPPRKGARRGKR